jgi:hypothetical protein
VPARPSGKGSLVPLRSKGKVMGSGRVGESSRFCFVNNIQLLLSARNRACDSTTVQRSSDDLIAENTVK